MNGPDGSRPVTAAMWARLREFQERSGELRERMMNVEGKAVDEDRTVAVVVGHTGNLVNLVITDEAKDKLSGEELSERIIELCDEANESIKKQLHVETKRVYGTAFSPRELADGQVSLGDVVAESRRQYGRG